MEGFRSGFLGKNYDNNQLRKMIEMALSHLFTMNYVSGGFDYST